jgi:hypothetical protein
MASRVRRSLLPLALAVALAGCGRGDEQVDAPNLTAWQGTFQAALDALGRQDYAALRALLTPVGKQTLDADLTLFGKMVADPVEGPRVMAKVRRRWPEVPDALVEAARAGSIPDAWALFLGAGVPRGQKPEGAGVKLDPKQKDVVTALYRYPGGPHLPMELKQVRGGWAVERISLGSP